MKVAFQGEHGAYSEQAAYIFFENPSIKGVPCMYFSDVINKVEEGEAVYGILPAENTIHGAVGEVYDFLLRTKLKICGELKMRIEHCLIAKEGVKLENVERVFSHPQALGQCREFIEKHELQVIPSHDTAGSVMMLKEENGKTAAIASERAAKIYNMKVLLKGIETIEENYTRFLIIFKEDSPYTGNDKTSISFQTKHTPGALYKILGEFAKRNLNLTYIHSRPVAEHPWVYRMFIDFEGHKEEERVQEAFYSAGQDMLYMKVLGSYPRCD